MSLAANEIRETSVELDAGNVVAEWVKKWFDGTSRAVGQAPAVVFPRVDHVKFGAGPVPENLRGTEIRIVFLPVGKERIAPDYGTRLASRPVVIGFLVSSQLPGEGQAAFATIKVSDLLQAILSNPESRYELVEKGITHFEAASVAVVPNEKFQQRMVKARCRLEWEISF